MYNVSVPTFRVKLDIFHLSKADTVSRCTADPGATSNGTGPRSEDGRPAHETLYLRGGTQHVANPSGQILASPGTTSGLREGLGRALCLHGHRRAVQQGHWGCFKSASLPQGSVP